MKSEAPSGIFVEGEDAKFEFLVTNATTEPQAGPLLLEWESDAGEKTRQTHEVSAEAHQSKSVACQLPSKEPGFYQLTVTCGKQKIETPYTFAIVRRQPEPRPSFDQAMFGVSFFKDMHAARLIGVQFVRTLVHWEFVEKAEGDYYWQEQIDMLADAEKENVGVIFTLVVRTPPEWLGITPADLMSSRYIGRYRSLVRELTQLLKDSPTPGAIEIQNEPDIALQYVNDYDDAKAAMTASFLLREGAKQVRSVDPEIPVLGMGVSGMDFRNDLKLSRSALRTASGSADYLAQHPYTEKRFVGPKGFDWPYEYPTVEYWRQSRELAKAHARKQAVWSTELGWGVESGEPLLSENNRLLAAMVSRAMLTAYACGIDKFAWFGGQLTWEEKGHRFSLFAQRDGVWQPTPAACAFATTASLFEGTRGGEPLDIDSRLIAYPFRRPGDDAWRIAIWAKDKPVEITGPSGSGVAVVDLYGRQESLESPGWRRTIGEAPQFFIVPASAVQGDSAQQPIFSTASND